MTKLIVHISEVNISPESGMGRVEYYWKESFSNAGYSFLHIGPSDIGPIKHSAFFPYRAYRFFRRLNIIPRALIVHEAASGLFVKKGIPCFLESHGVERRVWEDKLNGKIPSAPLSAKTKLIYPLWRLRNCDKGLKYADKLLLINKDDRDYVKNKYKRKEDDIFLFRNGIHAYPVVETSIDEFTVLFNGSWIERKGISVLIESAKILFEKGLRIKYLLIGTGRDESAVLRDWPEHLQPFVKVIPKFNQREENLYLSRASIFVLPSFSEGQPLSLLQAMAAGKCCITTNCCGQKDIIKNGETGFLFDLGDHRELASQIQYCFENREQSIEMGKKGKALIENFTWARVSNDVVQYVLRNS